MFHLLNARPERGFVGHGIRGQRYAFIGKNVGEFAFAQSGKQAKALRHAERRFLLTGSASETQGLRTFEVMQVEHLSAFKNSEANVLLRFITQSVQRFL